jgi:prepilin-type N-terminal cleavage/methylation domain-containing protein
MSDRQHKSGGFTLIELLVVIAIIAVSVSVLMPALSAAKVQSWKGQCLANLFEVGRVDSMYAQDDPQDILGPVHPESARFVLEGYAAYGGGPGDMPYQNWDDAFDPRTRPFNWILYGGIDAITRSSVAGDRRYFPHFQCPGDDFGWQEWPNMALQPEETERSYFFANGTAFRMNNLSDNQGVPTLAQQPAGTGGGSSGVTPTSLGIYGRPATRVPDASKMVSFMEARAFQTQWTNDVWGALTSGELSGCHQRLGFFNLSYVDGHAAAADMGDGTYFPKNPRFKNLDVRGTWGQFDCFPEDPLPEP